MYMRDTPGRQGLLSSDLICWIFRSHGIELVFCISYHQQENFIMALAQNYEVSVG